MDVLAACPARGPRPATGAARGFEAKRNQPASSTDRRNGTVIRRWQRGSRDRGDRAARQDCRGRGRRGGTGSPAPHRRVPVRGARRAGAAPRGGRLRRAAASASRVHCSRRETRSGNTRARPAGIDSRGIEQLAARLRARRCGNGTGRLRRRDVRRSLRGHRGRPGRRAPGLPARRRAAPPDAASGR